MAKDTYVVMLTAQELEDICDCIDDHLEHSFIRLRDSNRADRLSKVFDKLSKYDEEEVDISVEDGEPEALRTPR